VHCMHCYACMHDRLLTTILLATAGCSCCSRNIACGNLRTCTCRNLAYAMFPLHTMHIHQVLVHLLHDERGSGLCNLLGSSP
jgi:hypothetical protein